MLANDYEKIIKDNTDEEYGELKSSVKTIDKAVETLNTNIYRFECLYDTLEKHGYTPSMNDLLNSNKELEKSLGIELPTTNELIRMSEEQNKEVSVVLKAGLENFLKDIWDFIANIFKAIWNAIVRFFKFIFRIKDSSSSESAKEEAKSNMEKNKEAVDKASDQTVSNLKSVIEEVKDLNAFEKVLNGDDENVTDEMKEKVQKAKDDLDRLLSDKDSPLVFGEKLEKEVVAETKITEMKLFDLSKINIVSDLFTNCAAIATKKEHAFTIKYSIGALNYIKTNISSSSIDIDAFKNRLVKYNNELVNNKQSLINYSEVKSVLKILQDHGINLDSDDPGDIAVIRSLFRIFHSKYSKYISLTSITNKKIGNISLDNIYEKVSNFELNTSALVEVERQAKEIQSKLKEAQKLSDDISKIISSNEGNLKKYRFVLKHIKFFVSEIREQVEWYNAIIFLYQQFHNIQRSYVAAINIATGKGKQYINQIHKTLRYIKFPPIPASSEVYEEYKELAQKIAKIRETVDKKMK